jgi:hypothetical protein
MMQDAPGEYSPEDAAYLEEVEALVVAEHRTILTDSITTGLSVSNEYASFIARRRVADRLWEAYGILIEEVAPDA